MLNLNEVTRVVPAALKSAITQQFVDKINGIVSDPLIAEQVQQNFISYTSVLKDGKYKTDDYLSAVLYVSYKLLNHSNQDAWAKTFPERYAVLEERKATSREISSHVHAYSKNKLVNAILEQAMVPMWVLNQPLYQKALNVQADLMENSGSDMVRTTAANSILTHLAKPKEVAGAIAIELTESSGMTELKNLLSGLAKKSQELIGQGVPAKEIVSQKIIDVEAEPSAN